MHDAVGKTSVFYSQIMVLSFMSLPQYTAVVSLSRTIKLVFVMYWCCVLCEDRTEILDVIFSNFRAQGFNNVCHLLI